jgi:toxin ParE1/3/4
MPAYRISKAALNDLRDIGRHTEKTWGREQRRKYLAELDEKFALLSNNPRLAAEQNAFTPPVRIHHHERHLIVYVQDEAGIFILRVLHEAMDIPAQLAG